MIKPTGISLFCAIITFVMSAKLTPYFFALNGSISTFIALSYPPNTSTFPIALSLKRCGFIKLSEIFLISPSVMEEFFGLRAITSTGKVKSPAV